MSGFARKNFTLAILCSLRHSEKYQVFVNVVPTFKYTQYLVHLKSIKSWEPPARNPKGSDVGIEEQGGMPLGVC